MRDESYAGAQSCIECGSTDISWGGGHFGDYLPTVCKGCGEVEPNTVVIPEPCWICGEKIDKTTGLHLTMLNQWKGATGEMSCTSIPGVPDNCNCCAECLPESHRKIDETMEYLFQDGWDGSS